MVVVELRGPVQRDGLLREGVSGQGKAGDQQAMQQGANRCADFSSVDGKPPAPRWPVGAALWSSGLTN
jgi:hypothetical protein